MKFSLQELMAIVDDVVTSTKMSNSSFNATRDNTVGLLDKVGKIGTLDSVYTIDKLNMFDGEYLSFGKIIEDWFEDLILVEDHDPDGKGAMSPHDPTYRPVYYSYSLGRKKIPTTIRNNDLERAVHFEAQMVEIVAMKAKRLDDSMAQYRYGVKREMIAKFIDIAEDEMSSTTTFAKGTSYSTINTLLRSASSGQNIKYGILVKKYTADDADNWADAVEKGFIVELDLITTINAPVDDTTGEAFIKQVKEDIEVASDVSEGHSLNGNTLGATQGLVLIVKQGVIPSLEVDTYAGAFNQNQLAVPAEIVVVKDFGSADADYFAVLMDRRAMRLHNTYNATRDNANGDGDFLNIFRHTEDTAYLSRNAFFKAYKKPSA